MLDYTKSSAKRKRQEEDDSEYSPSIVFISDNKLLKESTKIPCIKIRNLVVDNLIESYGLTRFMKTIKSVPATEEDLKLFHASHYVEHLKSKRSDDASDNDEEDFESEINDSLTENDTEFGLGYDCPLMKNTFQFACTIAGGTLTAAEKLIKNEADIAINWAGGWHHAQRDEAEGFCYVNDIVLGIQHLLKMFNFVLYIDLDVHHGNGVENAFAYTQKVLTLSFHQYEPGFYPCSGSVSDVGLGNGKYFAVNVPLHEGICDSSYCSIFDRVASAVNSTYLPDAIVVQCGSDGLAHDPIGQFNLTHLGYGHCIRTILKWRKPTLFLGGGGYNIENTARCWTYLTSVIVNHEIGSDIPDECNYFSMFGPDFVLNVTPSNRKDMNSEDYIDEIVSTVISNLKYISQYNLT